MRLLALAQIVVSAGRGTANKPEVAAPAPSEIAAQVMLPTVEEFVPPYRGRGGARCRGHYRYEDEPRSGAGSIQGLEAPQALTKHCGYRADRSSSGCTADMRTDGREANPSTREGSARRLGHRVSVEAFAGFDAQFALIDVCAFEVVSPGLTVLASRTGDGVCGT